MRLDTECARGPPLLCHFSRRDEDGEQDKLKNAQAAPKRESQNDGPVRVAPRLPSSGRGERDPKRAALISPLSVRAVRTFGECQQPDLRGEPERATCQSHHRATNHEWSRPLGTFPGPARYGAARAALCGKSKAGDWITSSCAEARDASLRGIARIFTHWPDMLCISTY